jgi:hypothetical protein
MTQQTQLIYYSEPNCWVDSNTANQGSVYIDAFAPYQKTELSLPMRTPNSQENGLLNTDRLTFANGDTFNLVTGIYTFADGQPNRFLTATIDDGSTSTTDTPDIVTDSKLTSDIFRTTADGKKYYLSKATKYTSSDGSIDLTVGEQEVDFALNSQKATDLVNSIIADSDFLDEAQVTTIITGLLETYATSASVQTAIADFLKASDLANLSVNIKTTGNIEGAIIKAGTTIQFADGSSIKAIN